MKERPGELTQMLFWLSIASRSGIIGESELPS
jgi:hypothetical protein